MIHMRVAIELLWRWCPPALMDAWFGEYNMLAKFSFALGAMYGISVILAFIAYIFLEIPTAKVTPIILRVLGLVPCNQTEKKEK